MPAQYDAIKESLVKQGVGRSTDAKGIKERAAKIFIARGSGGTRSDRAKRLAKDRTNAR